MKISLSDHFSYRKLLHFCLGPISMMIFTSLYSVVDGIFVSNFAGDVPFKAINYIFPVIMILGAVGFMFGAGGTAVVSKTLGEGDRRSANRYFTLIVTATFVAGAVLAAIFFFLMRPIARLIGATGAVQDDAVTYAHILIVALPFFMLQNLFQSFFITAERPRLGFVFTLCSGLTNIVFDAVFIIGCKLGVAGAAIGTALSQAVGGILPLVYFGCKNSSVLRFVRFGLNWRVIGRSCVNGSSELLGNIAMSLVSIIYNWQLTRIVGDDGVAAFGVIMYVQFVFVAIFIGYCLGTAPIVGYNFGAQNRTELQNVFKKSMVVLTVTGVAMFVLAEGLADVVAHIFVSYSDELLAMTARGMRLYSVSYLFCGYCMYCSSFFTALSNGLVSAAVSFGRTLVFQLACIFLLPLLLGLDGVWLATPLAELLALALSIAMFAVNNKRYGYVAIAAKK